MMLRELTAGVPGARVSSRAADVDIDAVVYRSDLAAPGTIFACLRGLQADGHDFAPQAVAAGAGALIVERELPLDIPQMVVVDSRLEISAAARMLQPPGRALIYTTRSDVSRASALASDSVEVATLPADANGKTDLAAMLADLARRGVNELHVEAGEKLNASLLRAGLVDELLLYVAPRLLGEGRAIAAIGALGSLAESLDFEFIDVERVGADLRLRLRPPGRAEF